jgi:hypothetical protein
MVVKRRSMYMEKINECSNKCDQNKEYEALKDKIYEEYTQETEEVLNKYGKNTNKILEEFQKINKSTAEKFNNAEISQKYNSCIKENCKKLFIGFIKTHGMSIKNQIIALKKSLKKKGLTIDNIKQIENDIIECEKKLQHIKNIANWTDEELNRELKTITNFKKLNYYLFYLISENKLFFNNNKMIAL